MAPGSRYQLGLGAKRVQRSVALVDDCGSGVRLKRISIQGFCHLRARRSRDCDSYASVSFSLGHGKKRVDLRHRVEMAAVKYGLTARQENGAGATQCFYEPLSVSHDAPLLVFELAVIRTVPYPVLKS